MSYFREEQFGETRRVAGSSALEVFVEMPGEKSGRVVMPAAAFDADASQEDRAVTICSVVNGRIQRDGVDAVYEQLLSETGLMLDLSELSPSM